MATASKHIILAGGGTAGHVNPLLAVGAAIRRLDPQAQVTTLGTAVGLEADLVPQAGFELDTIEKVPFPRKPNAYLFKFPAKWHKEMKRVRQILEERQADVVVGFGGYASAPAYAAAHKMGLPIIIHEQNARAGMANKLGARWATFVGTAYSNTGLQGGRDTKIERVGLPLRPAIAELAQRMQEDRAAVRQQEAQALGLDPNRPIILVTGGSLGAVSLNKAVSGAAKELLAHAQIVHLTGKGKSAEVKAHVAHSAGSSALTGLGEQSEPGHDYHVAEYLERIDHAFGCADLVICRSGAGMVSELTALGLPAVYVPLPIGNGEQRFNAQPVVDAGGGIMCADSEFTSDWVREHIPPLVSNLALLEAFGTQAWQYGIRDAAERMARIVLDTAAQHEQQEQHEQHEA
ncbi:UDP-N-acetylglucosamine--N-acetylmuramyl-(pentap eptide) pyrophosphoryl-undecaprenol N-acetylglucosamine transferase [Bifidobacterium dolichotidis]|uniref:UDP-N-acetylglucosamine--N-acetylmuramyl-(pentapeptide) pyrophosphoryl-undecaprenol N-acetylglucosamine transferase n=1 Tax=Bifidobacterium dolichotidis TaxID=2306976 RepID=A0A430FS53_9BIFI|nr:undecaprenyldiphospho-muramoylpentapeptide beta-N-acetylglucosaminyltransferase [Bifidobacterium dolichotidis]RSX55701.1 UDP-N-acetylglucosamine--N-acetylmuramyl-(pentap eptide) pyrophosphoryl-undecaprenol N-acetylglucosamine transferase [Bifidobacterium dolichotidis]